MVKTDYLNDIDNIISCSNDTTYIDINNIDKNNKLDELEILDSQYDVINEKSVKILSHIDEIVYENMNSSFNSVMFDYVLTKRFIKRLSNRPYIYKN